ncbi:diguanylate cyclase [Neptunomonas sp.]|uniref:diguanylate cyclase domain-containing protein n=1 Tax=Neptunomonas sp. TaxID=1971898 RepID=UPI0025F4AEDA|nr:diguanylate cyclase [Neptunomonas sp.]
MTIWPAFMSLRWKVLIPLAFLLILINVVLYSYINQQLSHQYEATRGESHTRSLKALNGALTTSYHKLLEVAQTISTLTQSSSEDQILQVQKALDMSFTRLEAEGVLDSAVIFDPSAKLIKRWGHQNSSFDNIVGKAIEQEYPVRDLVCYNQCFRYIAIPLLSDGIVSGALVVGRVIQDTVLDFKQLTGVDIGIAKRVEQASADIENWSLSFTQMTQKNQNIQLLRLLSQTETAFVIDKLYSVRAFGHSYGVFFTVPESVKSIDTVWVFVQDETLNKERLDEAQFRVRLEIAIASLLMVLLIAMVMGSVTKRLRIILKTLAAGSISQKNQMIYQASLVDEIDQIQQKCIEINEEGSSLKKDGLAAVKSLEELSVTQLSGREVVTNLTSHANSVVLTQSMDGRVLTTNEFGKQLFGEFEHDPELTFSDCFLAGKNNLAAIDDMNKLYIGRESLVCFESQCVDLKGGSQYLYWIHTSMASNLDRPTILSIGIDITANKKAEERLAWLAFHDPVTEVANKRLFLQLLPEMMASSLENQRSIAVLCCEIKNLTDNHFSIDTTGGDVTLLSAAADRVSDCLRGDDVIARFGDELFMVILSSIKTEKNAGDVARKIITAFDKPFSIDSSNHKVNINIGICTFPSQSNDVAELVENAETAMYLSKEEGANNFKYSCVEPS